MRGFCLLCLLVLLLMNSLYAQVNLSNGLVALYSFNGNAYDVSGNNHHGQTINGPALTTDRFGNANSAYLFDGVNDYIRVTDNGSFSTPNFSLVVWFQSNSDNLQNLVGKRDFTTTAGSGGSQYQFFINYQPFPGIGSNLVGANSSCTNVSSSSYLNTNEWICRTKWYCTVVTFDGTRHKVYIDGVLKRDEQTSFSSFLSCGSDLRFGNWWQGDLIPFNGKMDDIRWYNRALNQAEVNALYDNFQNISGICGPSTSAGFLSPDTVCVNTPVQINNTSVNANSYYWNFCAANSNTNPVATSLGNFNLTTPSFTDVVKDGNDYYVFVTNKTPGKLTRLNFGNSLLNTPTQTDFGNLGGIIPDQCEGIQVIKNQGRWYAIIVGGQPTDRIVKVDFGVSLNNNGPIAANWGNIGGLAHPTDLRIFQDGANWYGLTVNSLNNTLTRFNFTTSFNNTPSGTNLGNIGGLNSPNGIEVINKDNAWYAFIINAGSAGSNSTDASLTRLTFGSSLLNTPTGSNLGNLNNSISSGRDLTIYQSCNEIFGFVVNNATGKEVVKLNFGNSITTTPAAMILGNLTNLNTPYSISRLQRVGADLYSFVADGNNNSLARIKLEGCTDVSLQGSTLQNPLPIVYTKPGIYSVNLTTNEGLATQSSYCKQVVVLDNSSSPTQNVSICFGDSVLLTSSNTGGNLWNTGSSNNSIYVNAAGKYWVKYSNGRCERVDTFNVSTSPTPILNLGTDTSFCNSDSLILNAGNPGATYLWQTGETTQTFVVKQSGLYHVKASYGGCSKSDSIQITVSANPLVNIGADTTLCSLDTLTLNAGNVGANYIWHNGQTTQAIFATQPGLYHVAVNFNGCVTEDSITIAHLISPSISITGDTTICKGESVLIQATGGDSFSWFPIGGLSNPSNSSTTASPDSSTLYTITATNANGCTAIDSVSITVVEKPIVELGPDRSLCELDSLTLNGGNPLATHLWQNNATTQTFIVRDAGLYFVTVSNNGCTSADSVLIDLLPRPQITLSTDTTICQTGMAVLNGGGGNAYEWSTATGFSDTTSATIAVSPNTTTTYYLTITAGNQCKAKDSVTVTVNPKPNFTIQSSKPVLCQGDTILLSAAGGDRYSWQPSAMVSSPFSSMTKAYPVSTTQFDVTIENDACRMTEVLSILLPVVDKPTTRITKSNDINCFLANATLQAYGGTSYLWRPSTGLSDSTVRAPIVNALQTTTYYASITSNEGCEVTDSITVYVNKGEDGSGFPVPNAFTPNGDGKNDCFGVPHWGSATEFSLNLYNRWGELVFHSGTPSNCWNGYYKGVLQPSDVYVYWIKAKTLCGDVFRKGTFTLIK